MQVFYRLTICSSKLYDRIIMIILFRPHIVFHQNVAGLICRNLTCYNAIKINSSRNESDNIGSVDIGTAAMVLCIVIGK